VALGAEATFVARTIDNDRQHLTEVLRQAAAHRGTAFVEIYQNCNVFNDGAFDLLREKSQGVHHQIRLVDGEPIIFDEGNKCVIVGDNGRLQVKPTSEVDPDRIVVHQAGGPSVTAVRAGASVAWTARGDLLRRVPQLRAAGVRRGDARAAAER
jgi:2-oxoglutarate ferredoxin oxidoreductase subunit beta